MRPSKPALPEWARPQDLAPTVENARRLGLPQAARPEAQHGSPAPSTAQQPAEPSWGQRLNRNMRQWGEGVIDRLDEAAVADGGGLVTALAALARTPARSFTSFMQGTAGTVSLLDGRVRGEISDGLSQVMSAPGLIGRAASDYWRSRTLADMAADLYANGAAGAMMGGAGAAALGRLNRLPRLGRDVGEIGQAAMRNISGGSPLPGSLAAQRGAVGNIGRAALQAAERRPSNSTRNGVVRTNAADWRTVRNLWDELGYGEILSDANCAAIARGKVPRVDDAWIAAFPEDAGLMGERISMHHINGSVVTIPLPATRHLDAHMPGGYRYNPGGPGGSAPFYKGK